MAHEIENNYAFFASNKPAWHGLGKVLKDAPNIQEAWNMAYPFDLYECALEATSTDSEGVKHSLPVSTHKAIIRSDEKQIGIVGEGYELEQPYEVLSFFEPYIESGLIELEAGGSLREGTRMWALGKVKHSESDIVSGDTVKAYLLAATAFDGSLCRLVKWCDTRVVCANTLAIAQTEKTTQWKVKHTKSMRSKISEVQMHVAQALAVHNEAIGQYRDLAHKPMSTAKMNAYITTVIAGDLPQKDWSSQLKTKVNTVIDLIDSQKGLELVPAIRGTAWQAYNAVSEYITHHAGRNEDNRLNNQWFDAGTQGLNQKALELALVA